MPTNRMPAISNEVPIGYLMKGEEMLSFMSAPRRGDGRIFSRRSGLAPGSSSGREGAVSSPAVRRFPDRESGTTCWRSIIAPAVVPRLETFAGLCDLRPIGDTIGNRPPDTDAVAGQRAGAGSAARQIELPGNAEFIRQASQIWAERIFVERHEDLAAVGQFCRQLIDLSGIDAVHEQRYVAQRNLRAGKRVRAAPSSSLRQSS